MSNTANMSTEELQAELAKRGATEAATGRLNIKIGNKQNVVVGGPALGQRFPVTLYAPSWLVLLSDENVAAIKEFIEENKKSLSWDKE